MSKDPFFSIKPPFDQINADQLDLLLRTSKHIRNVLFLPDELASRRIEGITFENVSFSKTKLEHLNFKSCHFVDCLFIGSEIVDVEFHDCAFVRCNFFKATFLEVYGRPAQFAGAVEGHKYSNIAVHLFQELRDNYADEMQPEDRQEAEFYFRTWSRRLLWSRLQTETRLRKLKFAVQWIVSFAHGVLFGYGFRLRNLLVTTLAVVFLFSCVANHWSPALFEISGQMTPVRSVYLTVTTMITMGAVGFSPLGDAGHLFVLLMATSGVVLVTATASSIAKRVAR